MTAIPLPPTTNPDHHADHHADYNSDQRHQPPPRQRYTSFLATDPAVAAAFLVKYLGAEPIPVDEIAAFQEDRQPPDFASAASAITTVGVRLGQSSIYFVAVRNATSTPRPLPSVHPHGQLWVGFGFIGGMTPVAGVAIATLPVVLTDHDHNFRICLRFLLMTMGIAGS